MSGSLPRLHQLRAWCWSTILGGHEEWYVCLYGGAVLFFLGLDGWIGIVGKPANGTLSLGVAAILLFYGEYGVVLGVCKLVKQTSGFTKAVSTDESPWLTLANGAILPFVTIVGSVRVARKPVRGLFVGFHEAFFVLFALVFASLGAYLLTVGLRRLMKRTTNRARKGG